MAKIYLLYLYHSVRLCLEPRQKRCLEARNFPYRCRCRRYCGNRYFYAELPCVFRCNELLRLCRAHNASRRKAPALCACSFGCRFQPCRLLSHGVRCLRRAEGLWIYALQTSEGSLCIKPRYPLRLSSVRLLFLRLLSHFPLDISLLLRILPVEVIHQYKNIS